MGNNRQREHNEMLVGLFSNTDIAEGHLEPAFRTISETCAQAMDVDRLAIWRARGRSTQNENEYCCEDAFERVQKTHASGEVLDIQQYPGLFSALLKDRVFSIPNVIDDQRTAGLSDDYWKPHHITSAICAPLWIRGRLGGFVTFEKNRDIPDWTQEEENFACQVADLCASVILTAQGQDLRRELDLYETTLNTFTQGTDPDAALHGLVRYAVQLLDCDCGLLFVNDHRRQQCCCKVSFNAPPDYANAVLRYGEDVAGTVAETGQSLLMRDYQAWAGRSAQFGRDRYSEVIGVPVLMGEKITGVIQLMRRAEQGTKRGGQETGRPFVDWDQKMLERIAKQVAVAFERDHLTERRTREENHRKAIHHMVDFAAQSEDLSIMVDSALGLVLECMAVTKGSVHVRPLVTARNLSPEEEAQISQVLDRDDRGFLANIRVEDWQNYNGSLAELIPLMNKLDIRASMFVPILAGSTYLGCICVHSPTPRAWSDLGIQQVQALSRLIAITADRLTSHQYLDTHSLLMAKLNNINRSLNRLFSFDEAVNLVGQGAVQLLSADQAAIFLRSPDGSITCPWFQGLPEAHLNRVMTSENADLAKMVLGFTTPNVIPEVKDSRLPAQFKKLLSSEKITSTITLPLIFSSQIVGAISCCFRGRRDLTTLERSVAEAFTSQASIAMQNAWMYDQMEQGYTDLALSLARAMDARDSTISDASLQVAEWAEETGRKLGLSDQEIRDLHWAALLHNIGKVSVPDEVLQKPGSLSEEEWRLIQQYPGKGEELIRPLTRFHNVGQIIRHARERFDGSGYPDHDKGDDIPLAARILSVSDAFTSMLDDRPYRKARNPQEAMNELERESGKQFDPQVVSVFVETVRGEQKTDGRRSGHRN